MDPESPEEPVSPTFVDRIAEARWSLLPAILGIGLLVALAGGAVTAASDVTVREALLAPTAFPVTATLAIVATTAGLGLAATGLVLDRVVRESRFVTLTQEGLVEEVSQEFHKVRDAIEATAERVEAQGARLSRVASATARLDAARADHEERIAAFESRARRAAERLGPLSVTVKTGTIGAPLARAAAPAASESVGAISADAPDGSRLSGELPG